MVVTVNVAAPREPVSEKARQGNASRAVRGNRMGHLVLCTRNLAPFRVGGASKTGRESRIMAGSMATKPTGPGQQERAEALYELLAERILVLDGATGTALQGQDLTAEDFGGARARRLQREPRPDAARRRPPDPRRLPRRRRRHRRDQHLRRHAARARRVRPRGQGPRDQPPGGRARARSGGRGLDRRDACASSPARWGPTTKAISVTGGVTFDELIGHFRDRRPSA